MAQLIKNKDDKYTFRKWNPEKEKVPYGEDTSAIREGNSCYCYYICNAVNCCCDMLAEEVVWEHWKSDEAPETIIKNKDEGIQKLSRYLRPALILMCIFGFYLLF